MKRYKVIDKSSSLYGRIGRPTFIEHDDGLKVLYFRKKHQPLPTPSNYTCGFYPNQLRELPTTTHQGGQ